MKKLKNRFGMTMAEVLIVVAILAVLFGVAFIAVNNHQRSLGQLERDGIAKEIFVAAQNHLTVAYGEGYLGLTDPDGGSVTVNPFGTKAGDGSYYFVVNGSTDAAVFDQILPFGSIDETVRAGGSYLIRYQKETGTVLDVFYCTTNGSPAQYNHTFFDGDDYSSVISKAGEDNKNARRNYLNGSILGWYGGAEAVTIATPLKEPTIEVVNKETLYVEVKNPNTGVVDSEGNPFEVSVRLLVKGLSSKTEHYFDVTGASQKIVLDDITSSDSHFANRVYDDNAGSNGFIPGENISVQAVAFSKTALANIAYSTKVEVNSLFESTADVLGADGEPGSDGILETAYIGNIRHLENLDALVSNIGTKTSGTDVQLFFVSSAKQTADLNWETFINSSLVSNKSVYYSTNKGDAFNPVKYTASKTYYPISPDYALTYDGQNKQVSDIAVTGCAQAGLFGFVSTVSDIRNLELLNFSVTGTATGTACAGTLAGTLNDCTVTNVLARNNEGTYTQKITAPTAGGLIGTTGSGTTVQYSAAAVIVNGTSTAGGLIGTSGGPVDHCYSGGHTSKGGYEEWVHSKGFDVIGVTAGGLIGSSSASVTNSYSTCSVCGTTVSGGLIGKVQGGGVSNCYAAGLIDNAQGGANYAFIASGTPSPFSDNYYYRVINQVEVTDDGNTEIKPMSPFTVASGEYVISENLTHIIPLDMNEKTYNDFAGNWENWNNARPYDPALVKYYSGRYTLRTVDELDTKLPDGYDNWNQLFVMTHHGDWPSPEVFFINTGNS